MVNLTSVNKTFETERGKVSAVDDLSISIERGEFFSLLGPSGCGKTTTMRCIAGLENPDAGEISIGDELVFSSSRRIAVPTHERQIGMVFQSYAIWPHMNVYDNVAFPLKHGMGKRPSPQTIKKAVGEALSLVQLEGFEKSHATQLSGGQQQRVALARALVKKPKLILLDEPLSNLDAKLRQETRLLLRELLKTVGATAVFVTHDQSEAFAVSDKIGVMANGRLVQLGSARDIYFHPSSAFVASFVGRINIVEGEVIQAGDRLLVQSEIGDVTCPCAGQHPVGQSVKLGIRAESLQECTGKAQQNCFHATVKTATFLGDYTECEVLLGDHVFGMRLPPETLVAVDDDITVELPVNCWYVLPDGQPVEGNVCSAPISADPLPVASNGQTPDAQTGVAD